MTLFLMITILFAMILSHGKRAGTMKDEVFCYEQVASDIN